MNSSHDFSSMSIAELRTLRTQLQQQEDVISFVRRIAQGRCDLARAELAKRKDGTPSSGLSVQEIANVFGHEHGGGSLRPPRETDIAAENQLVVELEKLCESIGFGAFRTVDNDSLAKMVLKLGEFESIRSSERKKLFDSIDALTSELVHRYKRDGVNVDALLED